MPVASRLGVLLVIGLLLIGGLAACGGGDDDDDGGGDAADDPAVAEAQAIFVEVGCAECHGENGEGDGENPKTEIMGTRMIIQQFRQRVRNGRGEAMPGYTEEQVSEEQLEMLYDWLHE